MRDIESILVSPTKSKCKKTRTQLLSDLTSTMTTSSAKDSSSRQKNCSVSPRKRSMSKPKEKRKNDFRAKGVNWLLTFPQCSTSKAEAIEKITGKENLQVKAVIAGEEKHADGNPHLHIIVCLEKSLQTRKANFWDFVGSKHGDYRVIKYPSKAYNYVTKEDKDPTIFGTIPPIFLGSKKLKSDECAQMIMSGCSVAKVVQTMPGYSLLNLAKIQTFKSYVTNVCSTKSTIRQLSETSYSGQDMSTRYIVDWLRGNLFKSRAFKAKQLWIYGPPNTLKTSLLIKLGTFCRTYQVPMDEDFYDSYEDDAYDLIVFDEFKSHKRIQWLNSFIQGGLPLPLRIKGGQIMKRKNLPVIFCSNYPIDSCYKSEMGIQSLKERIDEIAICDPIDLENIEWHLEDEAVPAPVVVEGNEKDEDMFEQSIEL